jgi:hypothetical protein
MTDPATDSIKRRKRNAIIQIGSGIIFETDEKLICSIFGHITSEHLKML